MKKKFNWVAWDIICKPKSKGGFGVKHFERFNIALLTKWIWRYLSDTYFVWYNLLSFKYENIHHRIRDGVIQRLDSKTSIWLRDILKMGHVILPGCNWFNRSLSVKSDNNMCTLFHKHCWTGHRPLLSLFSNLFAIATDPDCIIVDRGAWSHSNWRWNIQFQREALTETKNL